MEDTDIIAPYICFVAAIVPVTLLTFVIRAYILSYRHDKYIEKNFPEISKTETLSVFAANWEIGSSLMNTLSSTKAAPDEYVSIMRRKIRYSLLGAFLSMTVLPFGLFVLLVLILALKYWLT